MSDSVRPHRRHTRLPRPWDFPGKNTGVGCHFLLQCMKVKSESEVAQSSLTLRDPMDWSLPGSSVHGIFQAKVLEWGAIAFSNTIGVPNKTDMEQERDPHSHSGAWAQWKPPIQKDTGTQPSYNSQDGRKQTSKGWKWYRAKSNRTQPRKEWNQVSAAITNHPGMIVLSTGSETGNTS